MDLIVKGGKCNLITLLFFFPSLCKKRSYNHLLTIFFIYIFFFHFSITSPSSMLKFKN
jgi:hypothetical protein